MAEYNLANSFVVECEFCKSRNLVKHWVHLIYKTRTEVLKYVYAL